MTNPEAVKLAGLRLDTHLANIGGCGSGICVVSPPSGMHHNGGCKCSGNQMKMSRVMAAYRNYRKEVEGA